jgi:hypothetical protein
MTMRTSVYFFCENEHRREEETAENDQPLLKAVGARVAIDGLIKVGKEAYGTPRCVCACMQRPHEADEIDGRTTWHARKAPDDLKKLAVRTKRQGCPCSSRSRQTTRCCGSGAPSLLSGCEPRYAKRATTSGERKGSVSGHWDKYSSKHSLNFSSQDNVQMGRTELENTPPNKALIWTNRPKDLPVSRS